MRCGPCPRGRRPSGHRRGEEHRITVLGAGQPSAFRGVPRSEFGDRALALTVFEDDVTQPRRALRHGPSRSACRTSCAAVRRRPVREWRGPCRPFRPAGENLEVRTSQTPRDIGNDDRVAQIGLVVAVFQHRIRIGNARERCRCHRPRGLAVKPRIPRTHRQSPARWR